MLFFERMIIMMEFNSKQRRKSIKIWLSDEERILVEAKAEFYGYKRLAKYVRDAAIYENVTNMDIKNKEEIYNAYAENTKQLKYITKEIKHISRYATQITNENKKDLLDMMFMILKNQKSMIKLIDQKLDLNVWKEINHKKIEKMEEK